MKTAVAGYPRIGTLRELKFALEKYFRKEISADELTQTLFSSVSYERHTGLYRKRQGLIISQAMIFHIMI